jgi:anaerobic magnesium-protoporphyrin IX monomethyl ester cyclase
MNESMSKLKVLFINPPYERLKGLSVESVPMGLLSLATMVEQAGHEAKVLDADTSFEPGEFAYDNANRAETQTIYQDNLKKDAHPAWAEIKQLIRDFRPDVVGLTVMTNGYSSFQKVVHIINENEPRPLIIAGGPHVTICRNGFLEDNPKVDLAFVGEGEVTIVEFLKELGGAKDYQRVKGLLFRKAKNVIFSGERPFIEDLNTLPIPDRSLLHNEKKYRPAKMTQMMTSRGCPFECTYCASVPIWRRKVRRRSPAKLLEEIEYLSDRYHIRSFEFWDDTFTISKMDVLEFCRLLRERHGKKRFVWKCLTNINCLDAEMLDALRLAGCTSLSIGVESGSDRMLKMIKKRITRQRVKDAAKLIKSRGFWLNAFFMVGIPQETEEDIQQSISLVKEMAPDTVNLCTFTPYVGTELYHYVVDRGMLDPNDLTIYEKVGHHSTYNFFLEDVSRERYQELLKEFLDVANFMTNRKTLRKFMVKLRGITWEKLFYRLKQGLGPKRG